MKKTFYLLLFLVIIFPIKVSAATINDENPITYDIEKVYISGNTISFDGWAYIRRHNNVGGEGLKIYMTATDNSGSELGITKEVTNYLTHDLYSIMCVRTVSGNNGYGFCHSQEEALSRCNSSTNWDSCLYKNGKFKISFELSELYDKFGTNDIYFDLKLEDGDIVVKTRIGVYDALVTNNSQKWLTTYSTTKNVVIGVTSNPFYQKSNGERYKPQNKWNFKENIYVSRYQESTYTVPNTNNSVNVGIYCNYSGQCAFAPWVDKKDVFSIKITEKTTECDKELSIDLDCNNEGGSKGNYSSSCNYDIVGNEVSITFPANFPPGNCSITGLFDVEGYIEINQSGVIEFDLYRGPIYSGGGFTYKTIYNNKAYWEYTGTVQNVYSPNEEPNADNKCPYVYAPVSCVSRPCKGDTDAMCCYCSNEYKYYYSSDCNSYSSYNEIISKATAKKYLGLNGSNLITSAPDSNIVSSNLVDMQGEWICTDADVSNGWLPGVNNSLYSNCVYVLSDAYINKTDSSIVYGSGYNLTEYLSGNTEDGEPMYYVPLKWETGLFPIKSLYSGLSTVSGMNWFGTYKCDVNCKQKLYDLPNGGYLYYFRPISLSDPFPNGRDIGINWVDWINDSKNKERLIKTYSDSNNLEYTVTLSNSDIANIKNYNYNANYNGGRGYLNYSIDINGNSKFIKDYNYFTLGNVNHSGLGVFNPGDDIQ